MLLLVTQHFTNFMMTTGVLMNVWRICTTIWVPAVIMQPDGIYNSQHNSTLNSPTQIKYRGTPVRTFLYHVKFLLELQRQKDP